MKTRRFGAARALLVLLLAVTLAACGGPPARSADGTHAALPRAFADAFRREATGDPREAVESYLAITRSAAAADGDPWQIWALEASLDALAAREMPSLGDAAREAALANRTLEEPAIARELAGASALAKGPFARALIARVLAGMAQRRGAAADAQSQREASGCVREAAVVGPTTWAAVTGVDDPGPLDRADARLAASYPTGGAFGTLAHPILARAFGCAIGLSQESWQPGVRDVVVDVDVPRAQTIGLVLRAHGAATLRAGGTVVARRSFELGDGEAARFVRLAATAGKLRLVARVGTAKEDDAIEIDALGEDGAPLIASAPAIGSPSTAHASVAGPEGATPGTDDEKLLAAAAVLASGSPHEAERLLWGVATRSDARPDLALVYGRAVETARDLSAATRAERARSAYERVLEAWPGSWEATIAHAVLAGVRRGREEAGLETLRDLAAQRSTSTVASPPVLDAFEAMTAGGERLFDRARAALDRARPSLGGTALFAEAEDATSPEVGTERVQSACDPARPTPHDTLACLDAIRAAGDYPNETRELARLRAVLGAPGRYLALELRDASAAGDAATAGRAFAAMSVAERTLTALAMLREKPVGSADLLRMASTARDAPGAIAPLLRAAGDDPTDNLDAAAERLATEDRTQPILPNSATVVLAHTERYEATAEGLLHYLLFDVRRVSGTTDVEENAQAAAPSIWGRAAMHAVRRRILKRDGRILEPDRTPRASQDHADLSQLEQGDAVEAIYEGWSLPGDTGDIGIDTPDLLPERTSIHDATIELRIPRTLRGALWSHDLLGKASERVDGDARVLTWHLANQLARRIETGVPKMDRNVGVSFSTAQWADVARALRESIAALEDHDPEIGAWAKDAAGPDAAKAPRAAVNAIVTAAGKALREADASTLSDYGGGVAAVQAQTARTFLTSHDGSRSWLVLRGLRELGVACEVVVAENDPFSADPSFPPHFGRFLHPLVVAHVPGQGPGAHPEDVWIDADIAGPPLPAGRVSPELRGRLALRVDGTISPLPAFGSAVDERDEVDIRLALDASGDARGTFAVVLRGRDAQELAEALFRIVGAERQRALRDVVLAWLPWANVDDVQLASTEGSWQVGLRADVSVSGYAQPEGNKTWLLPGIDTLHWAWPRARVSSLAATFAARAGRESALSVASAMQYHVHRRIDLPKGAAVARIPGPLAITTSLVDASRKLAVAGDGSSIDDDFVLEIATGTIPRADYDAFVGAAHAADDGFLASTRVAAP